MTSPTEVSWVRRERKPELKSERSNGLSRRPAPKGGMVGTWIAWHIRII